MGLAGAILLGGLAFVSLRKIIRRQRIGHIVSISIMISFAKRIASAIALTVAGMRGVAEYWASLRAARIAAAISKTLLRPSSTRGSLAYSSFVRLGTPKPRQCKHYFHALAQKRLVYDSLF